MGMKMNKSWFACKLFKHFFCSRSSNCCCLFPFSRFSTYNFHSLLMWWWKIYEKQIISFELLSGTGKIWMFTQTIRSGKKNICFLNNTLQCPHFVSVKRSLPSERVSQHEKFNFFLSLHFLFCHLLRVEVNRRLKREESLTQFIVI